MAENQEDPLLETPLFDNLRKLITVSFFYSLFKFYFF